MAQVAAAVGRDHPFWGFQRDDANLDHAAFGRDRDAGRRVRETDAPHPGHGSVPAVCALRRRVPGVGSGQAAPRPGRGDRRHALLRGPAPSRFRWTLPGAQPGADHARGELWPCIGREPLPVDLTLLMSEAGDASELVVGMAAGRSGAVETVVMPGDTSRLIVHEIYSKADGADRGSAPAWIEKTEARVRSA